MIPTAEQVWAAALTDPTLAAEMPEGSPQREAMRPFIEGSVVALEGELDEPVTLLTLGAAKVKFLRYCVANNFGQVMGDVVGMGGDMITAMLEQLIEMIEPMLEDMYAFLEESGVTEEQVMFSPQIGMNEENQKKWLAGTLTIGELLLAQPAVILKNSN